MHNKGRITQLFKAAFVITAPTVKAPQHEPNVKYIVMWLKIRGIDHFCITIFIFSKKTQLKSWWCNFCLEFSDICRSGLQHFYLQDVSSHILPFFLIQRLVIWILYQLCSFNYDHNVDFMFTTSISFWSGHGFCSVETSSTQIMMINTHKSNTRCVGEVWSEHLSVQSQHESIKRNTLQENTIKQQL